MAQPEMHRKICLVTGGSSGFGKATAMGLAQLGATVILGCRDKQLITASCLDGYQGS
jgi:NAD(P)-dependent dehydrogenase (short-subunit alcohol dehydrogenase family)